MGADIQNGNNILEILAAMFPVFLYSFLIFILVPKGFLSGRRARRYLTAGFLGPILVYAFSYVFPHWRVPISPFMDFSTLSYNAFIQVAVIEEICKFITFAWVFSQRRNAGFDNPISVIYYSMMASAGFALIENISYLMDFGDSVLFIRAISAILMHMISGVIMGYFIQKAYIYKTVLFEKNSFYERFKLMFHKIKFVVYGIAAAVLFHGAYDLTIMLPYNLNQTYFVILVLAFGLVIGRLMLSEGIKLSVELRNKNYKKDIEKK